MTEEKGKNTDLLVFVKDGLDDSALTFRDQFIPDGIEKLNSSLTETGKTLFSVPESYSGALSGRDNTLIRSGTDTPQYWKDLFSTTGSDHIISVAGDAPFLDTSIISEMPVSYTHLRAHET